MGKYCSIGSPSVQIRDQYFMQSFWGSHECSAKSSPCKDIPDYFQGMMPVLNKVSIIYYDIIIEIIKRKPSMEFEN